ncbi:fasciclin domain-containing protein [Variovorax terrae]|uniref:Fasciclin domain-containing protein n=1 Tax=Variovorax terrae TaxID=2923278 RepID=A0A9X1VSK8_9BURK|nr:fasciclin domain-containing protein [Variovorax terrae]MCJ0763046.1 fasciclin domain-containing protein [Variovorax terrae]
MLNRRILFIAATAAFMAGCATQPAPVSVADTIAATPSLSTLNGLIAKAGLTDTLKGTGPFTVFAPSNDAFKAVPAKTLDDLANNPANLKAVLNYHVVPAKLMAANIKTASVKTVNGADVSLAKAGDFVTVEEAMVQTPDVAATNGVVHVVDRVLMPPRR